MNRPYPVLIGLLLGCVFSNSPPVLAQDARSNPNAAPAGIKEVKVKNADSLQMAAKLCAKLENQCVNYAITISLLKQDGLIYQKKLMPPTPIIQGGNIHVYAGQTLYVEGDLSGDKLTNLRLVQTIKHPEKTLIMRLTQQTKSPAPDNKSMVFVVYNPFDKNIKYHAVIVPLENSNGSGIKTSTCPVKAKKTAAEVWQYPLFQLMIKGFKLMDPEKKEVCDD